MPPGAGLPGGGPETVDRLERFALASGLEFFKALRAGLWAAEGWTVPRYGRPLSRLPFDVRLAAVDAWSRHSSRYVRWLLRGIVTPLKAAHFDSPDLFAHVGCGYGVEPPKSVEPERFMQQVTAGRDVDEDLGSGVRGRGRGHGRRRRSNGLRAGAAWPCGAHARGR